MDCKEPEAAPLQRLAQRSIEALATIMS